MSKGKNFLAETWSHVVALGVFKVLESIAAILLAGSALTMVASWGSGAITWLKPFGPIAWIFIFAAGSALILFLRARIRDTHPRFPALSFDFDVLEKRVLYEYDGQKPVRYTKGYTLRARRNGLSAYVDKFHWTGSGQLDMISTIPEHGLRLLDKRNLWQFYEIAFGRTLSKGEEIDTEIVWSLDDVKGTAVPFVSADIEEPTKRLILEVEFRNNPGVRQVLFSWSNTIGARVPNKTEAISLDYHQRAKRIVHRPQLLHHYELSWKMPQRYEH